MAEPSTKSSVADSRPAFADYQDLNSGNLFKDRLALAMSNKSWRNKDLSLASGVPEKRISDYLRSGKVPAAEYLFPLAEALDVSAEWLALNKKPKLAAAPVVDVDDAEWEEIPLFDLLNITDTGKGKPQSWTPFRKDWLMRTLGTAFDLYLVQLRSGYASRLGDRDLHEGDLVFVREITPGELADGHVVIWRREGALKVARFAVQNRDREEADVIYPEEVADDKFVPICRIYGKFLQRV